MLAALVAASTVVPPEGSMQASEVNVCGCPGAAFSASRYVPSSRPDTIFTLPAAPS